ncbi:hypothetical protein F5Y17DRAFT_163174 [Xylariaceae sp. FL0594]|nr:hypothetical protein F5Y17DRAFT_163174 [Xylariaceae sp. FL0594]
MAREKRKAPAPLHGINAAARRAKRERAMQYTDTWRTLNPLKAAPKMKHKSYFEAVENADRKRKKLEFEITTDREPPPGFEFIPTGHPELSHECKELSRENEAMFFIVSNSKDPEKLDHHMNRLGCHFRWPIVEEARKKLREKGHHEQAAYVHVPGKPEPIPTTQSEIDQEADAVLRDLFPRIPHTDRRQIIQHAFKKDGALNGACKVGMAKDITLARRVQLAALAHIRHNHTRYDELLKESDWANARKAVEKPCLDIIVKWRGDEETGRDQLDEILREVIEISDTETESDEEGGSDAEYACDYRSEAQAVPARAPLVSRPSHVSNQQPSVEHLTGDAAHLSSHTLPRHRGLTKAERKLEKRTARRTQQRFKRYAAAAEALASTADQVIHRGSHSAPRYVTVPMEDVLSQGPVNAYRAVPVTVPHKIGVPRNSYAQGEAQNMPLSRIHNASQDRIASVSHVPHGSPGWAGPREFIRMTGPQPPKAGSHPAHFQPLPSSSPLVTLGLQDMVLPSIEPRSPCSSRAPQDVSRSLRFEAQQIREVPPDSPANLDGQLAANHRRVITYFPEDYQRPPNASYVRVISRDHGGTFMRPQIEYIADREPRPPRVLEHVAYQDEITPASHEARGIWSKGNHDGPYRVERVEAPLRSRANPIVLDGNSAYEPRRIIELRGPPSHQINRTGSPRVGGVGTDVQGDWWSRDTTRVIYMDEPNRRFRDNEQESFRPIYHPPVPGPPAFSEVHAQPQSPAFGSQAYTRTVEQPSRYGAYQEIQDDPKQRSPLIESTNGKFRGLVLDDDAGFRAPRPHELTMTRQARQRHSDEHNVRREVRPSIDLSAGKEYQQAPQQPFPVHPAPSSYVDIRGPPALRRMPDHRGIIHVE